METGSRWAWRQRQRDLRGRMSETLVPEAWAEAISCWCQNVFLRACGQTEIKGRMASHIRKHTRVNGLSQFGFIMSQLSNVSSPHNAVRLDEQHALLGGEEERRGMGGRERIHTSVLQGQSESFSDGDRMVS